MEHSDFSKIIQTFLPIAIFILWAMFSNAGKKRKMRNFPDAKTQNTDHRSEERPKQEMPTYHKAPESEGKVQAKTKAADTEEPKVVITGQLPRHPSAMPYAIPSDLHMHISPARGASGPSPANDYARYSIEELQRLLVWSEILGRPKALRDPD